MTIVPVIFSSDKTNVTGSGSQCAHPVYITLGNFRWWIRNQDRGHAIGGLIPILNAGKQVKKLKTFNEYNEWLFHEFWRHFLAPLKECYRTGGFSLTVGGVKRRFKPVIAYFIQDNPEGTLLCGTKLGVAVHNPCRICWCDRAHANDPNYVGAFREEVCMNVLLYV